MISSERIVARFKGAATAPSIMDYALPLKRVVDDALRTIKSEAAASSRGNGDMKAPAGGVCYFLFGAIEAKPLGEKLWNLLDASAGLSAEFKWDNVAQKIATRIHGTPAERKVYAAAVAVTLLWRTRQQTKAQRAAVILSAALKDELAAMGPPAADVEVKAVTPTQRFMEYVTPEVREYAAQVAGVVKDPGKAAQLVWLALDDANAHSLSGTVESILSRLPQGEGGSVNPSDVSGHFHWEIEPIAAFGVALMEAVGAPAYAKRLIPVFVKDFADSLSGGL